MANPLHPKTYPSILLFTVLFMIAID